MQGGHDVADSDADRPDSLMVLPGDRPGREAERQNGGRHGPAGASPGGADRASAPSARELLRDLRERVPHLEALGCFL